MFLRICGRRMTFADDEAFDLIMRVAQSRIGLGERTAELAAHVRILRVRQGCQRRNSLAELRSVST